MTLTPVARLAASALLVPAAVAAQASAAAPPRGTERGAFVVLRAADTVAIERFVRAPTARGDSTAADLAVRGGPRARHTFVDSAGLVPRYTTEGFAPGAAPAAPPAGRATLRFTADTVFAEVAPGGAQRVAVRPGTLPWLNPSFVLVEQLVRRARALGGTRAEVPMVNVAGAAQFAARVEALGGDSVLVRFPDVEMRVAVDRAGRVTGARVPAQNVTVKRVAAPADAAGAPPR
jgi:hypothetical protein